MKYIVIFIILSLGSFVIDYSLNTESIIEEALTPYCQHKLYELNSTEEFTSQRCVYCAKTTKKQIGFNVISDNHRTEKHFERNLWHEYSHKYFMIENYINLNLLIICALMQPS
jgi:hypothetical protein